MYFLAACGRLRALARTCKAKGVPWVLDPVAAGFTPLRRGRKAMLLLLLCADLVQDYHGHGALRHRRVQLRKSSHVCFRGLWLRVRLSFLWTGMDSGASRKGFN